MLTENICQGIASEEAEHGSAQLLTPQLGDIRRSFTFRWVVTMYWCGVGVGVGVGVVRTVQLSSRAACGLVQVHGECKWSVSIENIHW